MTWAWYDRPLCPYLEVRTAALALLHYGLRRGQRWAGLAILGAVVPAETMNAVGMYAVDSFYSVSVAYLVLVILGVALVLSGDRARCDHDPH